jgi:DNA-binding transcriptional regulator LsrR (DeoR family)
MTRRANKALTATVAVHGDDDEADREEDDRVRLVVGVTHRDVRLRGVAAIIVGRFFDARAPARARRDVRAAGADFDGRRSGEVRRCGSSAWRATASTLPARGIST